MNRFVRIPITVMACVVWAGLALAQAPPPATAGAPRLLPGKGLVEGLARLRERHKVRVGVASCPCRS